MSLLDFRRNPAPGKLYDVNGRQIEQDVLWCDTETGEFEYIERDADDSYVLEDVEGLEGVKAPVIRKSMAPSPLRFVPDR